MATQTRKQYSNYLIDVTLKGVNRPFVSSTNNANNANRARHTDKFIPTVEIQDCSVMIYSRYVIDQPIKNNVRTYENIRKDLIG